MSQLTPYVLLSIAAGVANLSIPVANAQTLADAGTATRVEAVHAPGRVTVSFIESEVGDALRLVGRQCGVNMVISNDVKGAITLDLDGTTLDETLQAISKVSGLLYEQEGDIVTVYTLNEVLDSREKHQALLPEPIVEAPEPNETLVIQLRFVDAERVEPIIQTLLSETGSVSILKTSDHIARERGTQAQGGGNQQGGGQAQGQSGGNAAGFQIGSRLSTSSQGEPAKSHTIVVTDEPAALERIKRAINSIDLRPQQVVIEARFVEIALNDSQKLGIDWSVLARANGGSAPTTAPFGGSSLGTFSPNVAGGSPGGLFPAAPADVTLNGTRGLFTFGTLDFTSFSAVLEMVNRESDIEMVSNPSVVVRDRHTATILVGERYPILSANVSEFGTVTEQLDHYEPVGVQLVVTPSVLDGEVELVVRPSSSSLGADVEGTTGLRVARINSRQIDTNITVKDGQTVVIGGLITTREVDTDTSVPYLSRIPVLGRLFQSSNREEERVDLVVFLTVRIEQENGLSDAQRRLFDRTTFKIAPASHASDTRSPAGPRRANGAIDGEAQASIFDRTPLEFIASGPSY